MELSLNYTSLKREFVQEPTSGNPKHVAEQIGGALVGLLSEGQPKIPRRPWRHPDVPRATARACSH